MRFAAGGESFRLREVRGGVQLIRQDCVTVDGCLHALETTSTAEEVPSERGNGGDRPRMFKNGAFGDPLGRAYGRFAHAFDDTSTERSAERSWRVMLDTRRKDSQVYGSAASGEFPNGPPESAAAVVRMV